MGELTDRVARRMTGNGKGKMYCLAGIGAHLPGFIEITKSADGIIAIDGCPSACASKALAHAGFEPKVVNLKELGLLKGNSPVDEKNVEMVCLAVEKHTED